MPARKHRPSKHGAVDSTKAPTVKLRQIESSCIDRDLVDKLIWWEREHPRSGHYVGRSDEDSAKRLVKHGYLRESEGTLGGCFEVTEAFRQNFMRANRT